MLELNSGERKRESAGAFGVEMAATVAALCVCV